MVFSVRARLCAGSSRPEVSRGWVGPRCKRVFVSSILLWKIKEEEEEEEEEEERLSIRAVSRVGGRSTPVINWKTIISHSITRCKLAWVPTKLIMFTLTAFVGLIDISASQSLFCSFFPLVIENSPNRTDLIRFSFDSSFVQLVRHIFSDSLLFTWLLQMKHFVFRFSDEYILLR